MIYAHIITTEPLLLNRNARSRPPEHRLHSKAWQCDFEVTTGCQSLKEKARWSARRQTQPSPPNPRIDAMCPTGSRLQDMSRNCYLQGCCRQRTESLAGDSRNSEQCDSRAQIRLGPVASVRRKRRSCSIPSSAAESKTPTMKSTYQAMQLMQTRKHVRLG